MRVLFLKKMLMERGEVASWMGRAGDERNFMLNLAWARRSKDTREDIFDLSWGGMNFGGFWVGLTWILNRRTGLGPFYGGWSKYKKNEDDSYWGFGDGWRWESWRDLLWNIIWFEVRLRTEIERRKSSVCKIWWNTRRCAVELSLCGWYCLLESRVVIVLLR